LPCANTPENRKLLTLQKSLQQPLLTGTITFIKPSKDDGSKDVCFDFRYVDISGLNKDGGGADKSLGHTTGAEPANCSRTVQTVRQYYH
jgi:hypothetical protein